MTLDLLGPAREVEHRSGSRAKLWRQAVTIESEPAQRAKTLGFIARDLVPAGLPHRRSDGSCFVRHNGDLTFSISAHPVAGLPDGRYPRLLLIWITTEAVRRKNPVLQLGPTLTGIMAQLRLMPAGGRWGTIRQLRDQMTRLFSSTIAFTRDRRAAGEWFESGFRVTRETHLCWDPSNPGQCVSWRSNIELSPGFFEILADRPATLAGAVGAVA